MKKAQTANDDLLIFIFPQNRTATSSHLGKLGAMLRSLVTD